jgi:hypothetical protein
MVLPADRWGDGCEPAHDYGHRAHGVCPQFQTSSSILSATCAAAGAGAGASHGLIERLDKLTAGPIHRPVGHHRPASRRRAGSGLARWRCLAFRSGSHFFRAFADGPLHWAHDLRPAWLVPQLPT